MVFFFLRVSNKD